MMTMIRRVVLSMSPSPGLVSITPIRSTTQRPIAFKRSNAVAPSDRTIRRFVILVTANRFQSRQHNCVEVIANRPSWPRRGECPLISAPGGVPSLCLCDAEFRIDELAPEAVVVGFGGREAQHHHCVACCAHQVVTFFDNLPVLAVIKPKLFPPIVQMPEDFEPAGLHSGEHVHQSSFDTD